MIGLIICVIVIAVVMFVSAPAAARYLKSKGYSFQEDGDIKNFQFKKPQERFPSATEQALKPLVPEADAAMTDLQRAEELRLLQQAWNADQTK